MQTDDLSLSRGPIGRQVGWGMLYRSRAGSASAFLLDPCHGAMRGGEAGVDPEGAFDRADGLIQAALLEVRVAEIEPCLGEVGLGFGGTDEVGDGFVDPALKGERGPETVEDGAVGGRVAQGLVEMVNGLVGMTDPAQEISEIVMGLGVFGEDPEAFAVMGDGLVGATQFRCQKAGVEVGFLAVGTECETALEQFEGLGRMTGSHPLDALIRFGAARLLRIGVGGDGGGIGVR